MVASKEQTPEAALRRTRRVLQGHPSTGPDDPFPIKVYSEETLVIVDRDELELILNDYEDLLFRMAGLEK